MRHNMVFFLTSYVMYMRRQQTQHLGGDTLLIVRKNSS
jgi:hypothetical protein